MLSAEEAQAHVALDLEAQQDMKVGRWDVTPDIMSRWKTSQHLPRSGQ